MIKIFTMKHCSYCEAAKSLLVKRGIAFSEIEVERHDLKAWDELYRVSKMKTVPQIFSDARLIGGFQELAALDKIDALVSLKRT